MKYNLKNRPKRESLNMECSMIIGDFEEWFEGFEQELRHEYQLLNSTKHSQEIEGILQKIREILGVSKTDLLRKQT